MDDTDHRPPGAPFGTDRESMEREADVTFLKGSGPGGQHRNKRETGVRLVHGPSGVTVLATERRSQAMNLEAAFERLAERLEALNRVPRKRKATRVPRSVRKKRLADKKRRAQTKALRQPPGDE